MAGSPALRGPLPGGYSRIRPQVQSGPPADETVELFTDLSLLGAVPETVARATFARWLSTSPRGTIFALHWWLAQRDTAALRRAERALDAIARRDPKAQRVQLGLYGASAAAAYELLAAGDTLNALGRLLSLSDSLCP